MNKLDTQQAFKNGQDNRDKPYKIFDWVKAAHIIVDNDIKNAVAGLDGDFEWTADLILEKGKPLSDGYSYLWSTWATPTLVDADSEKEYPCFCTEDNNPRHYDKKSKWDEESLEILKKGKPKLEPKKKAVVLDDKTKRELTIVKERPMLMMDDEKE